MDSMIGKLRVALQLDSAAFESGADRAAKQVNALGFNMAQARSQFTSFGQGLDAAGAASMRVGQQFRAANDNAGMMRAGMQNLGFQLQDIAVQFASGQRAGTIFAQQLPQVAGAMTMMAQATGATTGVIGGLAKFMSGPWGIAVAVGAAVLSPLIAKLFDTKDAAEAAQGGLYGLIDAQRKLAAEKLKPTIAAIDLNKLRDERLRLSTKLDLPIAKGFNEQFEKENRAFYVKRLRELEFKIAEGQAALDQAEAAAKPIERMSIGRPTRSPGSGGSARSVGAATGKAYREGAEDELRKLQQTTNDILAQFKPFGDRTAEQFARRDKSSTAAIQAALSDVTKVVDENGNQIQHTNQRIGESFKQMSDDALNSLRELTSGIQSGDFLSILGGLMHTLESLGNIGLFGSKVQASVQAFRKTPAFANGTSFAPGGLALVGERGPELVNLPRGSQVYPNGTGPGGGGNVYHISGNLMTPEFWAMIQQGNIAAAQAGGEIGYRRVARSGSRNPGF
jgi:hypothetical protein